MKGPETSCDMLVVAASQPSKRGYTGSADFPQKAHHGHIVGFVVNVGGGGMVGFVWESKPSYRRASTNFKVLASSRALSLVSRKEQRERERRRNNFSPAE